MGLFPCFNKDLAFSLSPWETWGWHKSINTWEKGHLTDGEMHMLCLLLESLALLPWLPRCVCVFPTLTSVCTTLAPTAGTLCIPVSSTGTSTSPSTGKHWPRTIFRFNPLIFHVGLMQLKFVCFCPDPLSDLRFVCCWRSLLRLQGFSILHDYKNMAVSWLYVSDERSSFLFLQWDLSWYLRDGRAYSQNNAYLWLPKRKLLMDASYSSSLFTLISQLPMDSNSNWKNGIGFLGDSEVLTCCYK